MRTEDTTTPPLPLIDTGAVPRVEPAPGEAPSSGASAAPGASLVHPDLAAALHDTREQIQRLSARMQAILTRMDRHVTPSGSGYPDDVAALLSATEALRGLRVLLRDSGTLHRDLTDATRTARTDWKRAQPSARPTFDADYSASYEAGDDAVGTSAYAREPQKRDAHVELAGAVAGLERIETSLLLHVKRRAPTEHGSTGGEPGYALSGSAALSVPNSEAAGMMVMTKVEALMESFTTREREKEARRDAQAQQSRSGPITDPVEILTALQAIEKLEAAGLTQRAEELRTRLQAAEARAPSLNGTGMGAPRTDAKVHDV